MPDVTIRLQGLIAAVHHVKIDGGRRSDPLGVTFIAIDTEEAGRATGREYPKHTAHLAIPVQHLAGKTTCDDLITVREKEHSQHQQFAIWRLHRTEIIFKTLETPANDKLRITNLEVPNTGLPALPDLAFEWRGVEWLADLQRVLGRELFAKKSLFQAPGSVDPIVSVRVAVGIGEKVCLMPSPTYRRHKWRIGSHPEQAFVDAMQWDGEFKGDSLSMELRDLDSGATRTIDFQKGDVLLHLSNLPSIVERLSEDGGGYEIHKDFETFYQLLDGYGTAPGPVPGPAPGMEVSVRGGQKFGPMSVDPVFCMEALVYDRV